MFLAPPPDRKLQNRSTDLAHKIVCLLINTPQRRYGFQSILKSFLSHTEKEQKITMKLIEVSKHESKNNHTNA